MVSITLGWFPRYSIGYPARYIFLVGAALTTLSARFAGPPQRFCLTPARASRHSIRYQGREISAESFKITDGSVRLLCRAVYQLASNTNLKTPRQGQGGLRRRDIKSWGRRQPSKDALIPSRPVRRRRSSTRAGRGDGAPRFSGTPLVCIRSFQDTDQPTGGILVGSAQT